MKVVVLTTSYPRSPEDVAGRFVADAVERLRERGVEVEVVSPLSFRHFGIAYGDGVVGNLRRRPWLALLVPPMLGSFARAARRAARDADLVHAHWLPAGAVAAATGSRSSSSSGARTSSARRRALACAQDPAPRRGSRSAPSRSSPPRRGSSARATVRVIPSGVDVPEAVGEPDEPPHVLYAGRLSEEKGVLELVEAARGAAARRRRRRAAPRQVPGALGFVPHDELPRLYERAAVVACPSHREGFGVVCAEAMAHGRPVVARRVGGLRDLVVDGETGLLVPPGDVGALRAALERLLGDAAAAAARRAARERAREAFSWDRDAR